MTGPAIDWIAREKARYPGNCWVVPYPYTRGHFRVEGRYYALSDEAFLGFVEEMCGMGPSCAQGSGPLGPNPTPRAPIAAALKASQAATVVRSALRGHANAPTQLSPGVRIGLRRAMDYLRRPDALWVRQTLGILRAENAAALRMHEKNRAIYAIARALSLGMEIGACRAEWDGRNL